MIYRTREDRSPDRRNVFIFGDVPNETLKSLEILLEKDGYGTAIVKKNRSARSAGTESESVY